MLAPRFIRALGLVGVVAALALGAISMASAAPSTVETYRDCSPDGPTGEDTICFTIQSVEKLADPDDPYSAPVRETGFMLIEYFDADGNLLWNSKTRWHSFTVEKDGEWQVYHDQTKASYTYNGETCTATMNVNYANGETRNLGPEWEWTCR